MQENELFIQIKNLNLKENINLKKKKYFKFLRLKPYKSFLKQKNLKQRFLTQHLEFLSNSIAKNEFVICFLISDLLHFKSLLKAYGKIDLVFYYLSNTKIQKLSAGLSFNSNFSMGNFPAFRICTDFASFCKDLLFLLDFGLLLEIYYVKCFGYTFLDKDLPFKLIKEGLSKKFKTTVIQYNNLSFLLLNLFVFQIYFLFFLQGILNFNFLFFLRR